MQLPQEFRELAEASIGKEAFACFCNQFEKSAGDGVTSIRVNPFKSVVSETLSELSAPETLFGNTTPVPWCSKGYYLPERPTFTLDPLFHSGAYYVQEASSMYMELAALAIEQNLNNNALPDSFGKPDIKEESCRKSLFYGRSINALDLCAAPGGKSTHLVSLLGPDSLLVSNEVIKSRATILADNIAKWGVDNVVVTNNDPQDFKTFENHFHLIVVDAPCSGEGLFIKELEAINEWSLSNVNLCAQRQQRILADIWPALKPGGFLIYSTCTYNKYENDGNLAFLEQELNAEIIDIPLPDSLLKCNNIDIANGSCKILKTAKGGVQFVPGMIQGEGQFMAVVRKKLPEEDMSDYSNFFAVSSAGQHKNKNNKKAKDTLVVEKDCNYLSGEKYIMTLNGDLVKGYRKELYERIKFVENNLRTVLSGIAVANKKGKDYIPHADLALQQIVSQMISNGTLPSKIAVVEASRDDALKFLAKEPLVLKDAPLGYILLTYKGLGLGFLKNIGNRTNNLLPMARRIRMAIN